jgi:hypothetical protein
MRRNPTDSESSPLLAWFAPRRRRAAGGPTVAALLAVALFAGAAPGQGVVPTALDGVEGDSGSLIPFGLGQPVRMQVLYGEAALPFGPGTTLSRIRLRPDFEAGVAVVGKPFLTVEVILSTTSVSPDAASLTFDDNHGTDRTVVIANGSFALPSLPAASTGPHPFAVDLPFDQPWTFGLTPVFGSERPRNLCVEIRVVQQPQGAFRLDSPLDCTSQLGTFGLRDPSCLTGAGTLLELASSNTVLAGGSVNYQITGTRPSAPVAVALTLEERSSPLDLGDPALPRSAPGCYLNVDPFLTGFAVANPAGAATVGFGLPRDLRLVGLDLHAQAICADLSANPLGIVTSGGVTTSVCGPYPVTRIFALGSATAPTGQQNFGTCFVAEFL